MSQEVLSVYRTLLRVRANAFRGDVRALVAARNEIRKRFEKACPARPALCDPHKK